jgi:hypothetical protein
MKSIITTYLLREIDNKLSKILTDAINGNCNNVYHYRMHIEKVVDEIRTILEEYNK